MSNDNQKHLANVLDKSQLQNLNLLISKLDDKIVKQILDVKQLIDNIKLDDKIAKPKLDAKQLIDNIPPGINEDRLQQELTTLETNIKTYIQQQIQNIDDGDIQQQLTRINNEV
ncbi:hypothetical protein LOTGIDRAFT_163187 [Lottia gigantea]|uniref:Uncharacterized protein n=1 Tax=Lottia gigantea TaxID=225164 RepID=V4A9U7_LOTGI|nr:hypothetical protein LOTGIDRAFT_163187 [Lottia gigantea]ESO91825.1 hypothetical protein LOTGIDRAFT_163187 [Lottia gigantea]